jgi:hypothetical protein
MRLRTLLATAVVSAGIPTLVSAQQNAAVQRAQQAYQALDFSAALRNAQTALNQRLTQEDRILTYEILAFTYGALDSTRQAVAAFRELIFLDPNREPDVERVSPRITSLYASALGQVLVVRRTQADSSSFVAGQGMVPIRYQVSRPSRVFTRVIGPGIDAVIDSQLVAGTGGVQWDALGAGGEPLPPGDYQVVVTAQEGRNEFGTQLGVRIRHAPVDTVAHLVRLPGYTPQPEFVTPPRDWKPLGIALLATGLGAGAAVALENGQLEAGTREQLGGVSALVLITGLVMSIKKPDPQPVPANILYNQLLREQLAERNAAIAAENAARRRQTLLTVTPAIGGAP